MKYDFGLGDLKLEYWAYWAMIGSFGIIILGLGMFWAHLGDKAQFKDWAISGPLGSL